MSICNHKGFIGTKKCPFCYPNYGEVAEDVSTNDLSPLITIKANSPKATKPYIKRKKVRL